MGCGLADGYQSGYLDLVVIMQLVKERMAWRLSHVTECYAYWENSLTGKRKAIKTRFGYCPIDKEWIQNGW
jgi:hypothetical protein